MPNHVVNRLTVSGDPEIVKELLSNVKDDNTGIGSIDFNKIIPMPESLRIESGSNSVRGLKAYSEFIGEYAPDVAENVDSIDCIPPESEAAFLRAHPDITPIQWELGKTAFANQVRFGAPTWYEWSIKNWSTKWNAYDCRFRGNTGDNPELFFLTAWNAPYRVIKKLAEQYLGLRFVHEWADECIGENCGRGEYSKGHYVKETVPDGDEATSFADNLWGTFESADGCQNENESQTIGGIQL